MNWKNYINLTKNKPPHENTVKGFDYVKTPNSVLDVAAGGFRDSKWFVGHFKHIYAMDMVLAIEPPIGVSFRKTEFKDFKSPGHFDMVNAQYALPFAEDYFYPVWREIIKSIKPEGVFVGNFFGIKDGWNTPDSKIKFITKPEFDRMFRDFNIVYFEEVKKEDKTISGFLKFWHLYEVIAVKKPVN